MLDQPCIHTRITRYPYPQRIADMVDVRRSELAAHAHEIPLCPRGHGRMRHRDPAKQSYEALLCGIWYDCAQLTCRNSTTWPSREHAYDRGVPYSTGDGWEKFNGRRWVPASQAEVDAFWEQHAVWESSRQPNPRRSRVKART